MIVKLNDNSQLRRRVSRLTTGWVWLLLLPCVSNVSKDISLSLSQLATWHSSSVFSSALLRCSIFIVFRDLPGDISSQVSSKKIINVHIVCSRKAGDVLIFQETLLHSVPPLSLSLPSEKKVANDRQSPRIVKH